MKRKEFIEICCFVSIGCTTIGFIFQSCSNPNFFAKANVINNKIVLKKAEFKQTDFGNSNKRNFILIKIEAFEYPIYLYKFEEGDFSALLMKCTHLGCELQPYGDYLVCPCHGSEFTNRGKVQHSPADENLQTFEVTTDDENIYIHF